MWSRADRERSEWLWFPRTAKEILALRVDEHINEITPSSYEVSKPLQETMFPGWYGGKHVALGLFYELITLALFGGKHHSQFLINHIDVKHLSSILFL